MNDRVSLRNATNDLQAQRQPIHKSFLKVKVKQLSKRCKVCISPTYPAIKLYLTCSTCVNCVGLSLLSFKLSNTSHHISPVVPYNSILPFLVDYIQPDSNNKSEWSVLLLNLLLRSHFQLLFSSKFLVCK